MQQSLVLALGAATAILIAVLSLLRGDAPVFARTRPWMAPIGHFTLYGLLAHAAARSLQYAALSAPVSVAAAAVMATGFGAVLEFAQRFRPGRDSRAVDVLIDAAGAVVGASLTLL